MTRTLRHATALTDHRETERLDESLLMSVADFAGRPRRGMSSPSRAELQARLWRPSPLQANAAMASAPSAAPLLLSASLNGGPDTPDDHTARSALQEHRTVQAMRSGPQGQLNCITCVPIERHGQALAVLEIASGVPLSSARLTLVRGMCSLYANHLSLLRDSQIDTLTQLLNRKTFDDSIQRLLLHTQALAAPTWVAVVDIDHFKRINDGYGHLFGDEVLLLVAGMLRQSFRHQDKVFRFGGEEFVILLPQQDQAGATTALERLRQTIEQHRFPQIGQVTVSIGATAIHPGDAACDALGRADDALYHAKSSGRNRLCLHELLPASGTPVSSAVLHGDVDLF